MATNKSKSAALDSIKMQAANEVGVPLKDRGYNGDLTAKQVGSVGGQMVKKMILKHRYNFERINRRLPSHKKSLSYSVLITL